MLGLGKNSNYYREYNFINELKIKAVINHSIWSLDFYDENNFKNNLYDKGNLIIGEYPHIYTIIIMCILYILIYIKFFIIIYLYIFFYLLS